MALLLLLGSVPSAGAAIGFEEGPDSVKTPKFEWDFGDDGGTVEWVRELKWRDSGGTLSGDLTAENGVSGGGCGGAPTEFWGQSYGNQDSQGPAPVVSGTHGNWGARGGRSLELDSVTSTPCSGDTPGIPVRTRYSFFDGGAQANMVRVERRWDFAFNQISSNPAQGMRTYVPRLSSGVYNQEIYPKADGSGLNTDGIGEAIQTDWNDTWMAINASSTNSGVVLLRDPADTSPASIRVDYDSSSGSNNSGITLDRPAPDGWLAPITETEYLCFYDATSWPPGERSPTRLPDGCAPATPPINVTPPTVSAGAGSPTLGESFTASSGTWDFVTPGAFAFQWSRCDENPAEETICQEIPGATATSYTATGQDLGQSLRVAVTATGPGGEEDTAASNISGSISGTVYEGERASGKEAASAPVQVCRRSGSPCRSAVTDANGFYRVQVPVSGKYRVTAFPPSGSKAASRTRRTIARARPEEESGGQDVVLPLPQPPPPQVEFTGPGVRSKAPGGVPVVHWQEPFVLEYEAAKGAEVETKIAFPQAPTIRVRPASSEPSRKDPNEEIFKFPFPPLYPNHGDALISIVVLGGAGQAQEEIEAEEEEQEEEEQEDEEEEQEEPEEEETPEEEEAEEEREDEEEEEEEQEEENEEETTFPIYIDPSGFVRTTDGAPLPGATVTLFRSDAKAGPFTAVPDGSAVMSPMNRANPDQSEADGHFGWDVVAGFYKVRARKAGCNAPASPGSAFVETAVMTIPPPVVNLDIRLECPAPSNPSPPASVPQLGVPPASAPARHRKPKCRKGRVKKKVKGKARCVKKKKKRKKRRGKKRH